MFFNSYGKSQGLYDIVTAQTPSDMTSSSENKILSIVDDLFTEAEDFLLNSERSIGGIEHSAEITNISQETHEEKLQMVLNDFFSNPSFDYESISFAEFDLESTSYVDRRIQAFHNALSLLCPMLTSISNSSRLAIYQNPLDCHRTYILRKALHLETLNNGFAIDIVAVETIKQYQTLYSKSTNSIDVAKRTVGEYLRCFPCSTFFYLFDNQDQNVALSRSNPSRYIFIVKSEEVKIQARSTLEQLLQYFLSRTTANLSSLSLDSFLEIIVVDESNFVSKATYSIVPPTPSGIVLEYNAQEVSDPSSVNSEDIGLLPSSYSLFTKDAKRQPEVDAGDSKRISDIRSDTRKLSASISTYVVRSVPRELYLLTTGHKLSGIPSTLYFASPQLCLKPTPTLELINSIWPKYLPPNMTSLAFEARYRPPVHLPAFPIVVKCICDIAVVKWVTTQTYSYVEDDIAGGSDNNNNLSLSKPNAFLGEVQLDVSSGEVVKMTTVGAGHRVIFTNDEIIYQPLYISINCTTDTIMGDSGNCVRDCNGKLHSFYVGELANFHVSTPAAFAIRQAEHILNDKKLIPVSSIKKPNTCSIC